MCASWKSCGRLCRPTGDKLVDLFSGKGFEEVGRLEVNAVRTRECHERQGIRLRYHPASAAAVLRIHPPVHTGNMLACQLGDLLDAEFGNDGTCGFKVICAHVRHICDYRDYSQAIFAKFAIGKFAQIAIISP